MFYDEFVETTWVSNNKKYYVDLGYEYTGFRTKFKVKVTDLPKKSSARIKLLCDNPYCNNNWEVTYYNYTKIKDNAVNKNDYCSDCYGLKVKEIHEAEMREHFEVIKEFCKNKGLILLTKYYEYNGSKSKCIKYLCPKHLNKEIIIVSWSDLKYGSGCKYCGLESSIESRRHDYEFIKKEFHSCGYELLEDIYINRNQKMKFKCPDHPNEETYISYDHLKRGQGCKFCYLESFNRLSSISDYLRGKISQWKIDSAKKSNYKCFITGENFDVIHHIYSFNKIVEATFEETKISIRSTVSEYTEKELKTIEVKCIEIHYRYPLGVCLTDYIHRLFHAEYGYGNNTPDQFEEFRQNYLATKLNN